MSDKIVLDEKYIQKIKKQVAEVYAKEYVKKLKESDPFFNPSVYGVVPSKDSKIELTYGVEDISEIFECGRNTALRIMRLMMKYGRATKIGKAFRTTSTDVLAFIDENMGKEIAI